MKSGLFVKWKYKTHRKSTPWMSWILELFSQNFLNVINKIEALQIEKNVKQPTRR